VDLASKQGNVSVGSSSLTRGVPRAEIIGNSCAVASLDLMLGPVEAEGCIYAEMNMSSIRKTVPLTATVNSIASNKPYDANRTDWHSEGGINVVEISPTLLVLTDIGRFVELKNLNLSVESKR
jgi:hypothetical protein